jgi:allophanate hydrolase
VAFALGTDTAGSGRIPAGFNNLVGVKPTPSSLPMQGVLPACKTIDVVSILALTVSDGSQILKIMQNSSSGEFVLTGLEPKLQPPWLQRLGHRLKVGIPKKPGTDVSLGYDAAYKQTLEFAEQLGWELIEIDMSILFETAQLLYEGP